MIFQNSQTSQTTTGRQKQPGQRSRLSCKPFPGEGTSYKPGRSFGWIQKQLPWQPLGLRGARPTTVHVHGTEFEKHRGRTEKERKREGGRRRGGGKAKLSNTQSPQVPACTVASLQMFTLDQTGGQLVAIDPLPRRVREWTWDFSFWEKDGGKPHTHTLKHTSIQIHIRKMTAKLTNRFRNCKEKKRRNF